MTDPWDKRYIYLLIYTKKQRNVGIDYTVNIPNVGFRVDIYVYIGYGPLPECQSPPELLTCFGGIP